MTNPTNPFSRCPACGTPLRTDVPLQRCPVCDVLLPWKPADRSDPRQHHTPESDSRQHPPAAAVQHMRRLWQKFPRIHRET